MSIPFQEIFFVAMVFIVDKQDLLEKIGTLSHKRFNQVLEGINLLLAPGDIKE